MKTPVGLRDRNSMRRKRSPRLLSIPHHLRGVMSASPLPPVPDRVDWTKQNTLQFPMDANNQYGDCMYAAACHMSQSMTGNVGVEDTFDVNAIVQSYLKLAGGDNGLDMDTLMAGWKQGLAGTDHRILDDMSINPTDRHAMVLGMYLFGGILFTLGIPNRWLILHNAPGGTWDSGWFVRANDGNGHGVLLNGWDGQTYKMQTWGYNPPINLTPAGVAICDPEADVVFSLDWFDASGKAPNGFTYDQLAAFWVQLGGNPLPASPFVPAPLPLPPVNTFTVASAIKAGTYPVGSGTLTLPSDLAVGSYQIAS